MPGKQEVEAALTLLRSTLKTSTFKAQFIQSHVDKYRLMDIYDKVYTGSADLLAGLPPTKEQVAEADDYSIICVLANLAIGHLLIEDGIRLMKAELGQHESP